MKLPRRLAAAFLAPWLALVLAELPALHVCQVHDLAHASMQHSAPTTGHSHHASPASDHSSHHNGGKCSCLDAAAHSPLLALAARAPAVVAEQVVTTKVAFVPAPEESLPGRVDFRTPFPLGPPAIAYAGHQSA